MILSVGFDLVEIERIRQVLQREPRFAQRILTPAEQAYCLSGRVGAERVAGRWAAKEAVAKALGRAFGWQEVEIVPDERGSPQVQLYGRAVQHVQKGRVLVSITHTREIAAAIALWVTE